MLEYYSADELRMFHALAIVNGWWDAQDLAGTVAAAVHNAVMTLGAIHGLPLKEEAFADPADFALRDFGDTKKPEQPSGGFDVVKGMAVR